jgi:hypothetical protein
MPLLGLWAEGLMAERSCEPFAVGREFGGAAVEGRPATARLRTCGAALA